MRKEYLSGECERLAAIPEDVPGEAQDLLLGRNAIGRALQKFKRRSNTRRAARISKWNSRSNPAARKVLAVATGGLVARPGKARRIARTIFHKAPTALFTMPVLAAKGTGRTGKRIKARRARRQYVRD